MTITAKALVDAKFASSGANTEYTAPANTRTIIDKFTATNTDSSARAITVYVVPSGQTFAAQYTVTSAFSIAANTAVELTELKNHILSAGDVISVFASVASVVVIRASGREIT